MGMTEAAWNAPSASRIAVLGVLLGVAGGCILGALFGAGVLVIDALANEPLQLGTVVARLLAGSLFGLIYGAAVGALGSIVVVPVITIWLRTAGVQGRSVKWVQRRAQLLAMVVTALAVYCATVAFADRSELFGSFVALVVPGLIAIVYAGWAAHRLVLDDPQALGHGVLDWFFG